MRFHDITSCDVNNGEGFRVTLWLAGCTHHCPGQPFTEADRDYLISELDHPYIQGLTLSGGDPLDSLDDLLPLVKYIRAKLPSKDIWLYTGYTIEQIKASRLKAILPYVDVIVDGPYIAAQRDVSLAFRGSANQRIIELSHPQDEKSKNTY